MNFKDIEKEIKKQEADKAKASKKVKEQLAKIEERKKELQKELTTIAKSYDEKINGLNKAKKEYERLMAKANEELAKGAELVKGKSAKTNTEVTETNPDSQV